MGGLIDIEQKGCEFRWHIYLNLQLSYISPALNQGA